MKPSPATDLHRFDLGYQPPKRESWETLVDYAITLGALMVLAPVFISIALYIKVVSRGPVIFKQKRVGFDGQPFMIFKFRTMHLNASTAGHENYTANLVHSDAPMMKLDAHDSRLIPLGKYIRAAGLDELPQLINVLHREMSVVGPRPSLPTEYAEYSSHEKERVQTLPGLTGLWQVSGKNELTFDQMIKLDIEYVKCKNLRLYTVIVVKTPLVLIKQLLQSRVPGVLTSMPTGSVQRYEKEAVGQ